jgi:proline racemase
MAEKQALFESESRAIRESVLMEPRGHRNMLGAVVTDPVTEGAALGVLFTHPHGYFDMCGDSAFSLASFLVDSRVIDAAPGEHSVLVDTVAGPVTLELLVADGECISSTIRNVPSYSLGTGTFQTEGGPVAALLAYGGLTYAMVHRSEVGVGSLRFADLDAAARHEVVDAGSAAWAAAQRGCTSDAGQEVSVDLVTLFEPLEGDRGVRVANFYGVGTMGRTPSGTGLSARIAWEYAEGHLSPGEEYIHESVLGLRFHGRVESVHESSAGEAPPRGPSVVPAITARSFLMGVNAVVMKGDDPFRDGFEL